MKLQKIWQIQVYSLQKFIYKIPKKILLKITIQKIKVQKMIMQKKNVQKIFLCTKDKQFKFKQKKNQNVQMFNQVKTKETFAKENSKKPKDKYIE